MSSPESEQERISEEYKDMYFKKQRLLEMLRIQNLFQEKRNLTRLVQTEEAESHQQKIDSITDELEKLTDRMAELQKGSDIILLPNEENNRKEISFISSLKIQPPVPAPACMDLSDNPPPNFTPPKVFLDSDKLPPCPCNTQCPECGQFVTTETFSTVNSGTWLACYMTAMLGCVAGCCLLPFCIDRFKTIRHRCPKCRSSFGEIRNL